MTYSGLLLPPSGKVSKNIITNDVLIAYNRTGSQEIIELTQFTYSNTVNIHWNYWHSEFCSSFSYNYVLTVN
jgi:hypothetical protein